MDIKAKIKQEWPAIAILALATLARLTLLSIKPPHFDEGVNGWFVDQMTHTGFYHYDPDNYHGPLHFYILFLAQTLLGRHIWALRLPLCLAGIAAVYLTLKFDRFIGRDASRWAALAMALSPGCVFYSRYAIHEYWLVLALMLCAWGMAGLWASGGRFYFWAIVSGITVAVLTKETYFIHFGCALLTLPVVWLLGRIGPAIAAGPLPRQQWTTRDYLVGLVVFIGSVLFFYSGAFMDIRGLKGLYQTYGAWAHTGRNGNGHEKAWYYWVQLFARYEWPALIGLIVSLIFAVPRRVRPFSLVAMGILLALFDLDILRHGLTWHGVSLNLLARSLIVTLTVLLYLGTYLVLLIPEVPTPRAVRALGIYGCGALAAYSIIHYKTPWCIVSLTWPFILLFGWAVDALLKRYRDAPATAAAIRASIAGILLASAIYMVALNFYRYTDPREQYVYVQTFPDVNKLMDPLNQLVARDPANYQLTGHIVLDSYHPLPWLLGDFPNIGYYNDAATPQEMDADFILVEETRIDDVEAGLRDSYFTTPLHLRDAQDVSTLYLSVRKFGSLFPGRKPDFVPVPKAIAPLPAASPSVSP